MPARRIGGLSRTSPALLDFVAFAPPLYAALGMIAQRKPNQDKGFKDLPLYFWGSRPFFWRRTSWVRSMLRELIIEFGLPLVFANAPPECLGLLLGALPTLGLTGMRTFSGSIATGPFSHGFIDVAPRPDEPAAWRAEGYALEPLIIDDAANDAPRVAVRSSST